ncbi:MAG: hypothetical protein JJW01_00835 [Alphaproteobacteria bacterium]|nr:hypothetical protein [Rickettsiales bacterium]
MSNKKSNQNIDLISDIQFAVGTPSDIESKTKAYVEAFLNSDEGKIILEKLLRKHSYAALEEIKEAREEVGKAERKVNITERKIHSLSIALTFISGITVSVLIAYFVLHRSFFGCKIKILEQQIEQKCTKQ